METTTTETDTEVQAEVEPDDQTPDTAGAQDTTPEQAEQETFPREYVEKLRKESAGYRDKAKDRDALAGRLHTALVAATGRLADPSDLPFDPAHLDDPDALTSAVDELLNSKPHLASRRVSGNVGQGATDTASSVDLAGILRARAN